MKSNTDSNALTGDALIIKSALAAHLAKTGHTLQDLEVALASNDKGKTGELLKDAGAGDFASGLKDFLLGVGQLGLGGSMLYGGLGGFGLYGGYKGLKDSNKKLDEADAVKQRINLARRELEGELASPQH